MKAIIITQPGGPEVLQIAERPKPLCGADEVLVKVCKTPIGTKKLTGYFNQKKYRIMNVRKNAPPSALP